MFEHQSPNRDGAVAAAMYDGNECDSIAQSIDGRPSGIGQGCGHLGNAYVGSTGSAEFFEMDRNAFRQRLWVVASFEGTHDAPLGVGIGDTADDASQFPEVL